MNGWMLFADAQRARDDEIRSTYFARFVQQRGATISITSPLDEAPTLRTCEQCFAEYVEGTGVTEDYRSQIRLTERFCSESCADAYNRAFDEDEDER